MSERVLCVFAHYDDEAFACLGTLLKHKKNKDRVEFLWFTGTSEAVNGVVKVPRYFKSSNITEFCTEKDQHLDEIPLTAIIRKIEDKLFAYKPDIVYTNYLFDLNRDHRVVAEAVFVACRPYKNNAPKEVWQGYIAGTTNLGLRKFVKDRTEQVDVDKKRKLIKAWYPGELKNGREVVDNTEYFERWPRVG